MCILITGGFFLIAEQYLLLKWSLSKLLGNSPAPQKRAREAMATEGFFASLQNSAETPSLYEMGDAGEGGL